MKNMWKSIIDFPIQGREEKPRQIGLTMIIDKGLGLNHTKDLLELGNGYFDSLKLGFGTSALYPSEVLQKKIELVKSYNINIYPGGTFFEVALLQGETKAYFETAKKLGFDAIEISDGTIEIDQITRINCIKDAIAYGFKVFTEIGKKDGDVELDWRACIEAIKEDLAAGAYKVIIEGRESGKGVGMYDASGAILEDPFVKLKESINIDSLIFEAPLKEQQQELITIFGPNVNLGNINPNDIIALEALRVGLRGDTLKATVK